MSAQRKWIAAPCLLLACAMAMVIGAPAVRAQYDAEAEAPKRQGITASVLLRDEFNEWTEMPPDETFYSGERFRFRILSRRSGYLYVLLRDAQGEASLMYPTRQELEDGGNRISRARHQVVPARDYFRLDENPGTEKVLILVASSRRPDLERAAKAGGALPRSVAQRYLRDEEGDAEEGDKGIVRYPRRGENSPIPNAEMLLLRLVHLPR